uniref:BREX-1 system phosphatase PglZ type A n=1 Tax=Prevotella sp. TaxID=59823 RepID=UPI004024E540
MVQERIYSYFDRNPQLHVLFIFDKMEMIRAELSTAEWKEGYRYVIFDGAWFNVKYNIEHTWKDENVVLLFSDISYPHSEQQQLHFPLMDLLRANMEYKEEDYASFMQQYGLPDMFAPFVKRHVAELTTSKVMNIIGDYYHSETFSQDLVFRGLITGYLGEKRLLDWPTIIVKLIILGSESEQKKRMDFFNRLEKNIDVKNALDNKLTSLFGFSYNANSETKVERIAECLKYNCMTQLLDAANADNYKQYKTTNAVIVQLNKIYEVGTQNRQYSMKFGEAMKELASGIKEENVIEWYGIDAQYFYMTEALGWPILKEVAEKQLASDPDAVVEMMRKLYVKMPMDSTIRIAIRFIEQVAQYYQTTKNVDTLKLDTPDQYVSRYTSELYRFDLFYRHALECFHSVIKDTTPIDDVLGRTKQQLDMDYAKTINLLNLEWLTCVNENPKHFESISIPRQADFYHDQVDKGIHMAVIISDALRYEVATEMMEELSKEKHIATLAPMLAMLPTETKYCKPSMLPHHKLELQGAEMTVDGLPVSSIDQRTEVLSHYVDNGACIKYEDLMNKPAASYREFFKQHHIVYIFHDAIDDAGHKQNPFEVIRACKQAITELTTLISRLHATWNVYDVLLTADHGFLYNDIEFEEKDKHNVTDESVEKKTRYYLTHDANVVEGISKYPLQEVSEIQSSSQVYVAVPDGTNRMAAQGGYQFAHGGATLEEMIVPVIYSKLKKVNKTEKVEATLMNHNLNMVSSRLKFNLIQSEAVSMTKMERELICCVYDGDKKVTEEKKVTLNSPDKDNLNNRVFEVTLDLKVSNASSILQLRIYDADDMLNPYIKETVKNNTFIEQDF